MRRGAACAHGDDDAPFSRRGEQRPQRTENRFGRPVVSAAGSLHAPPLATSVPTGRPAREARNGGGDTGVEESFRTRAAGS